MGGYRPVFYATAVAKAKAEGAIILGKSVQDEFGFGTFSVNVGAGEIPLNPIDTSRSCGGSSGGAAGFAALTEHTHIAMAESTGGSIAAPASFCGMASITPTYGLVSRYGLMDYANSLDKIGAIGKSVEDAWLLLSVMAGHDPKDTTSADVQIPNYESFLGKDIKGKKLAVPTEFLNNLDPEVKKAFNDSIDKLKKQGAIIENISLPLNANYSVSVYYIIATAEASTNLSKYCGLRYGYSE
ncbi:MAG TPA: Asp-tRNA(Asn)/Glu-tRNA(Gln) amidotransferase subunit GatA, partial [Candidatus Diapherotrites archaeon]|nr:Asp-tRNA(Asn)/Glu-tRNA(Gln) amidotransferase subunit GatA [Candidatus Diapherotrites archaeon]